MHSAPAVSYPVGRSRFQGQLIVVLGLIGCLAGLAWCATVERLGWRQGLFFVILSLACWVASLAWSRSSVGELTWDGQGWRFNGALGALNGEVRLQLDLQFCMLLRLRSDDGRRWWLWSEKRSAPAGWLALRRAVMSNAADRSAQPSAEAVALLKP